MNYAKHDKIDLQHFFFLSNNFLYIYFFTYICYSSAKYYQNNKARQQKNARERYQCLSKEEKK